MSIIRRPAINVPSRVKDVLESIPTFGFIAGGFAVASIHGDYSNVGDIDIFRRSDRSDDEERIQQALHELGFSISGSSPAATSYKSAAIRLPIQVVHPMINRVTNARTFGTPEEVISSFDLTINQAFIESPNLEVCYTQECADSLNDNAIRFANLTNPLRALYRALKYYRKGFTLGLGEAAKLGRSFRRVDDSKFDEAENILRANDSDRWEELETLFLLDVEISERKNESDSAEVFDNAEMWF